jgi:hypothetical protein
VAGAAVTLALATSGLAADTGRPLSGMEGRYSYRFPNGMVTGERFTSENVLEIVRLDPRRA